MIKVKVIEDFFFGRYNEVKNIVKANNKGISNHFEKGDTFECQKDVAEYLVKDNKLGKPFVEIIEIIPDKKETKKQVSEQVSEQVEKTKRTRRTKVEK